MKKFLFLLMAGTMLCGGAYAKHDCDCSDCRAKMERKMMTGGRGGFVDAAAKPLSVAEVQKLSDDAYVTMAKLIKTLPVLRLRLNLLLWLTNCKCLPISGRHLFNVRVPFKANVSPDGYIRLERKRRLLI